MKDQELEDNHVVLLDKIKSYIILDSTCTMEMNNSEYKITVTVNPNKLGRIFECFRTLTFGRLSKWDHKELGAELGIGINRELCISVNEYLSKDCDS